MVHFFSKHLKQIPKKWWWTAPWPQLYRSKLSAWISSSKSQKSLRSCTSLCESIGKVCLEPQRLYWKGFHCLGSRFGEGKNEIVAYLRWYVYLCILWMFKYVLSIPGTCMSILRLQKSSKKVPNYDQNRGHQRVRGRHHNDLTENLD